MFRRSLFIFGAIVLLGLAMTVGYALLGFGGPHNTIQSARILFQEGEYLRVVTDLDLCERSFSLKRDPPKHRELLRLRYLAHYHLGNSPAALRDLDALLAMTQDPGENLRLDHVRLLALTGSGERALQEIRAFLEEQPEHGPALELAGEACQTTYREELRAVLGTVDFDVGAQRMERAREALLAYLYRPDADTEVQQAIESLRQVYAQDSHQIAAWPQLMKRIQALRTRIQESLAYFQSSLEHDGQQVAAFRGLALSLEQSQRFDDLLILCECYRRRFDHPYVCEAGAMAAWALVGLGHHQAAIKTTIRWLPPGTVEQRFLDQKLGPATLDVYLAQIVAAWQLRDRPALERMRSDLHALINSGLPLQLASSLMRGLLFHIREDYEKSEVQLARAARVVLRSTTPHGQQDLLPLISKVRIENLRLSNAAPSAISDLYAIWIDARQTALEPLVALATFQLESGSFPAAMATARAAQKLAPNDEDILRLRTRIGQQLYHDSDQDGAGLLAQCLERITSAPNVPDPIGYLLCGEAALAANVAWIALGCGHAALDAMPWARAGRLLEAKAEMMAKRPAAAARILGELLASKPPDSETLLLALAAYDPAEQATQDLLSTAIRRISPDDGLAATLLRLCQSEDPQVALPLAHGLLARTDLPTELVVLTASAFARAGDRKTAERLVRSLDSDDPAVHANRRDLALAIASLLRLAAGTVTDEALTDLARQWSHDFGLISETAAPELFTLARDLHDKNPKTAYWLLTTALATAAPEDRSGEQHALAGDLAFQLGRLAAAETHWTAALAFPDGRTAAEPLARLCLATDRPERATQIYRLAVDPTDPALALRCGNIAVAERLITESIAADGGDLLTHVVVTVVGMPSLTGDLVLENDAEREALLELASLLRASELATFALPRAQQLAAEKPGPSATLLLARAHTLAGNQKVASRMHGQLFVEGLKSLTFWREVAVAWSRPGYEPVPTVARELIAAAAQGELEDSPFAFAMANMRIADSVAASGHEGIALQYRANVWQHFSVDQHLPAFARPTLADAELLIDAGRPLEAWWVLDRMRPTLAAADRLICVERMLAMAHILAAAESSDGSQRKTLYAAVVQLAEVEGPTGSIVHYLLDHRAAFPDLAPNKKRTFALLTGHLHLAAAGRDRSNLVAKTVELLTAQHGAGKALEAVEAALLAHPLALDLWRERTLLMQQNRRGVEGVDDMRRVLAHVESPEHVLDFTIQAAIGFALTQADVEAFAKLKSKLRNSTRGKFANGLIMLRQGKANRAVTLLEAAGNEGGARRLMALAQALLQCNLEDAPARALAVLEQLSADYPSSSAARYAGNFARQLSPR